MRGKLLDTNAIIALQRRDRGFIQLFGAETEVFLPVIAVGELYYGAANSERVEKNTQAIERLLSEVAVLGCDEVTARFFGSIRHRLRLKGRPIPENDIWIAAIALQYDLVVVTRDAHFREVEGLSVESW